MMVLEVIYETATLKLIAVQEIDRAKHDWGILLGQAFLKLDLPMPTGDISQYKITADLSGFELDLNYKSEDKRLQEKQQEWDQQANAINALDSNMDTIKPILLNLIGERPARVSISRGMQK